MLITLTNFPFSVYTDSSWIEMNKVNVSIRVADRGVVGNHLYVVYQVTLFIELHHFDLLVIDYWV